MLERPLNADGGGYRGVRIPCGAGHAPTFVDSRRKTVRKARGYFETNGDRMLCARFRRQGLIVGSGVVEAGCKTVLGLRLQQPGMQWTVKGANALIALRAAESPEETREWA